MPVVYFWISHPVGLLTLPIIKCIDAPISCITQYLKLSQNIKPFKNSTFDSRFYSNTTISTAVTRNRLLKWKWHHYIKTYHTKPIHHSLYFTNGPTIYTKPTQRQKHSIPIMITGVLDHSKHSLNTTNEYW